MTALIAHTHPDMINLLDRAVFDRPPETDPNVVGTRCDQSRHTSQLMMATHDGCPGWWGRGVHDQDSLTCACDCHEERYGWPHWEQAKNRFLGR